MKLKDIRLVELEIHSYCNRQCKFCPNSFIDRHSKQINMKESIFKKIINELVEVDYSNYISFSRYNEPFADPILLRKRVNYIKRVLPDVKLVTNTNGDYDTTEFENDIDITHMDYSKPLPFKINNRGGVIKGDFELRTLPCLEPTYFVGIDFTGDVVSCCNFRHDIESHIPYLLGNVKNNTLNEIINDEKAVKFRKDVKDCNFPTLCKYCSKMAGRYTRNNPDKKGDMS